MHLKAPSSRGWVFAIATGVVTLALPYVLHPHHHHDAWWNHVPGFYAAYGFLGCAAIVLVSKWLGGVFLQRSEDFYAPREELER